MCAPRQRAHRAPGAGGGASRPEQSTRSEFLQARRLLERGMWKPIDSFRKVHYGRPIIRSQRNGWRLP